MKQLDALAAAQEMLPEIAAGLTLDRHHAIGATYGHTDEFYIWDHHEGACEILAHSTHSWEHALAMLKPDHIENTTRPDRSPVEDEVGA